MGTIAGKDGDENWEQYTALDPQANYLYRQAENIKNLKRGNWVSRSEYDHDTGEFKEQERVDAKKYISPMRVTFTLFTHS